MTTPAKIAADTARILLDTKSVNFRPDDPYTLASGLKSPSYIDCRRLISFPKERARLMDNLVASIRASGVEFDNIAGGETAGIPFAALVAERMGLPMTYVRKKPKGYGRNARIEGVIEEGQNVLLLEDMTTDGGSKISFVEAIREAGATCTHTAVIFFYDIFPQSRPNLAKHGIELINMATWADVLSEAKKGDYFDAPTLKEVEAFLSDPAGWSMAREG